MFQLSKHYSKSPFPLPSSSPASPAFPAPSVCLSRADPGPPPPSSWHYKMTSDTSKQLRRSPPLYADSSYTKTRSCDARSTTAAEMPAGERREPCRIQNDGLVPLSAGGFAKEFPLFFPRPSILCLSDPFNPSRCTLARGLTLKSGSLSTPNVINLPHSPRLFFTYNGNGLSGSPLKSLTSQRAPIPGTWQRAGGRTLQSRSF